jgi:hypothetical protein
VDGRVEGLEALFELRGAQRALHPRRFVHPVELAHAHLDLRAARHVSACTRQRQGRSARALSCITQTWSIKSARGFNRFSPM